VHDSLKIHGEGTAFFNTETTNGQIHTVHLDNVCYIPNGSNRLLSQGQLCLEGLIEKADSKSTTFSLPTGRVFLRGFPRNETDMLHWVRSQIAHPNVPMAEPSLFLVNYNSWHLRMAHPSKNVLQHIGTNTNGFTPNLTFPLDSGICPGCAKGKMHNKPFPPSGKRAKQPFDLIHADLVQLPKKSYHKKEWACLLMDDYSSYAYCYLLRSKSEATSAITTFLELIKNQHTKVIKKFRSNHGGEFDNNSLDKLFASKGLIHEYSTPHIHTQNGRAEALNRIILEKAESMLNVHNLGGNLASTLLFIFITEHH
jgi:transposase InsO family protein